MAEDTVPMINDIVDEHSTLLPQPIKKPTPLPKVQISVLLLLQLAEPITSQCILPFITQLIRELDITDGDEAAVGYYAGLIISIFFAVEALAVMQWSRLSDHIGRKPVLIIGLFGLCISMLLFGLSKTFGALLLSRCLAGALNGNIGIMKSMMAEITDSTNIAQGFALMPVAWSVGSTIGPVIGGTFARPYNRFPRFHTAFWQKFPYFLPCLVSASFTAIVCVLVIFLLKETVTRRGPEKVNDPSTMSDSAETATQLARDAPVPLRSLFVYPILLSIGNYTLLALLEIAMIALFPLFYSSSLEYGGLGLSPSSIGIILGSFGLFDGLFQAFFFAKIVRKWGVKILFITGMAAFVPIFLMFPVIHYMARQWGLSPAVWVAISLQLLLAIIMDMTYGCMFMYISSAAPNRRSLGATNGLAQTSASIFRALGPAAATSLFALSVKHNLLGGYAVYLILAVMSGLSLLVAVQLPKELWKSD